MRKLLQSPVRSCNFVESLKFWFSWGNLHCIRDILYLLGALNFSEGLWSAVGSSGSPWDEPGATKGWWAETPQAPFFPQWTTGEEPFLFLLCRLILFKQNDNNPLIIMKRKKKTFSLYSYTSSYNTAMIYISYQICQNAWNERLKKILYHLLYF